MSVQFGLTLYTRNVVCTSKISRLSVNYCWLRDIIIGKEHPICRCHCPQEFVPYFVTKMSLYLMIFCPFGRTGLNTACHFSHCLIVGLASSKKLLLLHHRSVSNSVSTMYNKNKEQEGTKERQNMYQSLQVYQLYTYSIVTCECPSSGRKCKKNSPCFVPH